MKKDKPVFTATEQELIEDLLRQKLSRHRPRVQFKEQLYHRLAHDHLMDKRWFFRLGHYFHIFKRFSVTTAMLAFVSVFSLTTTYAYFSPTVTPESALFPLKKSVESVDLAFSSTPEEKVQKLVRFTERRKVERTYLREIGRTKTLRTDREIQQNLTAAAEILSSVKKSNWNAVVAESVVEEGLMEDFSRYPNLAFPTVASEEEDPQDVDSAVADEGNPALDPKPDDVPNVTIPSTLPAVVVPTINPLDYEQEFEESAAKFEMGGAGSTLNSTYEAMEMAPKSQPACTSLCSSGKTYQCGFNGVQYCQDIDGDGCYEFTACEEAELPLGVDLDDYEWEF